MKLCRLLAFVLALAPAFALGRHDAERFQLSTTGTDSRGSIPLGNGDIGLNVWVETNGDLVFYISKTDAWSDDVVGGKGLIKLGRVRVRFEPRLNEKNQLVDQYLDYHTGRLHVTFGRGDKWRGSFCIWVDANRPVIHVEPIFKSRVRETVSLEPLRPTAAEGLQADTILEHQKDCIVWYYRNKNTKVPRLTNLTFGAMIRGVGTIAENRATLNSRQVSWLPAPEISIHVLTAQTATPEEWITKLQRQAHDDDAADCSQAQLDQTVWWTNWCNRSWIKLHGFPQADVIRRGYAAQRYVTACAGRGAYPIKFNGSIFTMDWVRHAKHGGEKDITMSPDARDWGGQYWFQNTRAMYWPMLAAGDFEMMLPLFRMYKDQLPGNAQAVREYYGHGGAYLAETNPFWGSLPNLKPSDAGSFTRHYYTPILELTAMGLDYFTYTGDRRFVAETLLPIARAGTAFFDEHFPHEHGKLLLDPDNAIETYWKSRNPAPDLAGLRFDLAGLLALPSDLTTAEDRAHWQRMMTELPDLPTGTKKGTRVLLPAEVIDRGHNSENPELYSIYPFRLYGLGKPGLELARATFAARRFKTNGCWRQDGVQAALLGDTETARDNVTFVLTHVDNQCLFPAFWDHGSDYVPDEDNGGNGAQTLQKMLLQADGDRILLLPAWPKEWSADFKLHAPKQTTVEGTIARGRLESLRVVPEARMRDVLVKQADGSFRPWR